MNIKNALCTHTYKLQIIIFAVAISRLVQSGTIEPAKSQFGEFAVSIKICSLCTWLERRKTPETHN